MKPNAGAHSHGGPGGGSHNHGVWTKSFASAIRGSGESETEPKAPFSTKRNEFIPNFQLQNVKNTTKLKKEKLNEQHTYQIESINSLQEVLTQLESMINEQTNSEEYMKTKAALEEKLREREEKKSRLVAEMDRIEMECRVAEMNCEINDDSFDIFNQIEAERRKGYQEYIESPDNDSGITEDEDYSNTTPEPSRTPTMFNVNASEFKPSPKRASENYCLSAYKGDSSNTGSQPTVTYHQPGYMILPVRTAAALSPVSNNLMVMNHHNLYISKNQNF